MAQVRIDIASEFKDKGFKKADKAATMLDKQFKNLARTFVAVFSTRQIIAFGRAAVKAFEEDEIAARKLSQTLNNLNLGFEDPRIAKFISNVEAQSGILDDELRPAMQALLTTTGSVIKSQEMLNLAIEVSRGSGESLTTVANDLAKAYVGNTRSLAKYNLGLSKTELQTKSFAELQTLLNKQFSGQNAAYLETYAGKVSILNVAYANMQETIGKGLVDAFVELSGDKGIAGASKAMDDFASNVAYSIYGVVGYIQMLDRSISGIGVNPLIKWFIENQGAVQLLQQLISTGKGLANAPKPFKTPMTISGQSDLYSKQDKERIRAEKEAAKREKERLALEKKAELERQKRERIALAKKRANSVFDMETIQIVAALQGKIDGEERTRLTTLLALQTDNYTAAEKLADIVLRLNAPALANLGVMIEAGDTIDKVIEKLITSQAKLAGLQLIAEDFPVPEDIFQSWEDSLNEVLKKLLEIFDLLDKKNTFENNHLGLPPEEWRKWREGERGSTFRGSAVGSSSAVTGLDFLPTVTNNANAMVVVNVAGNVTSERDLVTVITDQIYQQQKSGKQITYSSQAI